MHTDTVTVETEADGLHNVTEQIKRIVAEAGVINGVCTVFCQHTSAGLMINEDDAALRADIKEKLYDLVPHDADADYEHGTHEHQPNAHAHLKTMLLNTDHSIPVTDGSLVLGTYQSVFLVDFDGPRERTIIVHVDGA